MNYSAFRKPFCFPALFIAFLFVSFSGIASSEIRKDSIGVERKGNKILVLYKVEAGETLSSISRKYNTTVDAIKAENAISGNSLNLGDIVKVPYQPSAAKMATAGKKTHIVEASQGLYSIARTYGVTVEDIKKWNNLTSEGVQLGQELIVGEEQNTTDTQQNASRSASANNSQVTKENEPQVNAKVNDAGKRVHIVEASQGLFAISKMYGIPLEDLRKWNSLTTDNLRVGQELFLEDGGQTVAQVAENQIPEVPPVVEGPKETDKRKDKEAEKRERQEKKEAKENVAPVSNSQPVTAQTTTPSAENNNASKPGDANYTIANTSGYVKKVEVGLAESIGESQDNDMFLALHRTAPVGTIMQVRNQMNDLSVFVKVIGKLPDTGPNDKLVVKISRRAYERLAAIDKRFRVEVSYMP